MPLFILLDHSMESQGGHHYEYACRVLDAARAKGYRPVLATNKQFRPEPELPFEIYPIYEIGFWPRPPSAKHTKFAAALVKSGLRAFRLLRYRLLFSSLGSIWLMRGSPVAYLKSRPYESGPAMALLCVGGVGFLAISLVTRCLLSLVPFRERIAASLGTAVSAIRSLAVQIGDAISPSGSLASWRFARAKRADFARATTRLLRKLPLSERDVVFVPTLGESEMVALLDVFDRVEAASRPSYHLLFRRNLYEGRESTFDSQDDPLLPVRNAFLRFRTKKTSQRAYFYTDTEELSRQYNRMGVFSFGVCPIPHTVPLAEGPLRGDPLRVTYLGDARREKGYHHLPGLVQDLWAEYALKEKVKFVFQSNYNVDPGEAAAVVARGQLSTFPEEYVRLILKPCSSAKYRDLLVNAGIVVLPYSSLQYYARSSGVLIEALSAGIPVVVPPHCWLSGQIAEPGERYRWQLASSEWAQPALSLDWRLDDVRSECVAPPSGPYRIGGAGSGLAAWIDVPQGASHLLASVRADWTPGAFVALHSDHCDEARRKIFTAREILGPGGPEGRACSLIAVGSGTRRIRISLSNAFEEATVSLFEASARWLTLPAGQAIPMSAAGVAYSSETPAALAGAVREVLDHYDHYRRTARDFAATIGERHSAGRLIERLRTV